MTGDSGFTFNRGAWIVAAVALLAVGAAGAWMLMRPGDRAGTATAGDGVKGAGREAGGANGSVESARVVVNERGYEPATVSVQRGRPLRLTFVRTTDKTCGTEVVFPSLNITRPLPLNQPVIVEFTPEKTGEVVFECGMKMLRGTVVVQPPSAR